MMPMVSGGKDAFEKSFICDLNLILERGVAALHAVKPLRQPEKIGRQSSRLRRQCAAEPLTDLGADCLAVNAGNFNAVWILTGHEGVPIVAIHPAGTKSQNRDWFIGNRDAREWNFSPAASARPPA